MAATPSDQVYQFKITLKDVKPPVWRRIQVPGDYSFWDLHVAIQDAMGWLDYHLHAFHVKNSRTGRNEEIGIPDDDPMWDDHPVLPGWKRRISQYFSSKNPRAQYEYDFGDGWEHRLVLEKILPAEAGVVYPRCLSGKRACPPEDCGGVWGYANMLEILSNPRHKEYKSTVEWLGGEFDPDDFDPTEVYFSDPEERWKIAFTEEEDLNDGGSLDDEEDAPDLADGLRAISRGQMHRIWKKAKANELEDLSKEEQQIGRIMLEHEGEFFNEFEYADLTHDRRYDPETDVNPFLHVTIHSVAENQLADRDPIEVFQFYNAVRQKNCSHHEAVHLIGAILAPLMFRTMRDEESFDVETYCDLLKKYKTRNPEKIPRLLEKEPMLYDT